MKAPFSSAQLHGSVLAKEAGALGHLRLAGSNGACVFQRSQVPKLDEIWAVHVSE